MSQSANHPTSEGSQPFPQLEEIAAAVEQLGSVVEELRSDFMPQAIEERTISRRELSVLAQAFYKFRRTRDIVFDFDIFSEPAWDVLLDLFIAKEQGKAVTVSSACAASAVPPTTALRHIDTLVRFGLARRQRDARDARLTLVELTREGHHKMEELLQEWHVIRRTVERKSEARR